MCIDFQPGDDWDACSTLKWQVATFQKKTSKDILWKSQLKHILNE